MMMMMFEVSLTGLGNKLRLYNDDDDDDRSSFHRSVKETSIDMMMMMMMVEVSFTGL